MLYRTSGQKRNVSGEGGPELKSDARSLALHTAPGPRIKCRIRTHMGLHANKLRQTTDIMIYQIHGFEDGIHKQVIKQY